MEKRIAIIEDEPDIAELIGIHLEKSGYRVKTFGDGASFYEYTENSSPDLLILDLMLPDMDGYDICRQIKNNDGTAALPIIILSAKSDEVDKILGLELGADDYIVKPFSPRELVARVKAIMRRYLAGDQSRTTEIGGLVLDNDRYSVSVDSTTVELTPFEFRILELLTARQGWVFTRETILSSLWGEDKTVKSRSIDVHILNLRNKIGRYGRHIKSVRGIGYTFEQ